MAISHRRLRVLSATALASSAWLGLVFQAHGQTWEGDVGYDWFDGGNWAGGVAPSAGSTVTIKTSGILSTPAIDGIASAATVFVGGLPLGTSLRIGNGGSLTTTTAIIGNSSVNAASPAASEVGEATVSGTGSTWTTDALHVGYYGAGDLNIEAGGKVVVNSGRIGQQAGSIGTVDVIGTGALWNNAGSSGTIVGDGGQGRLNVSYGASAVSYSASLGNAAGSKGIANILGNGSLWQITNGNLVVGQSGIGELHISNGAQVDAKARTWLGGGSGSSGLMTVTGAGSTLKSATDVRIGQSSVADITVADGGKVESAGIYLGFNGGSSGTLTVTDANSRVAANAAMILGLSGSGTAIVRSGGTIYGGSTLTIASGAASSSSLNIGALEGSSAAAAGNIEVAPATGKIFFGAGTGRLVFNHTGFAYDFSTPITGNASKGAIRQIAGVTRLTGDSSGFSGSTSILGGTLKVDNKLGGTVTASGTGTLAGAGRVSGNVDMTGGGVLTGASGQTLTIGGSLVLGSASAVNVALGAAHSTPLFDIGTSLTLDGTLNVTDFGGLGAGVYRLFNYGGSFVDNGLLFGSVPGGTSSSDFRLQVLSNRVNLLSTVNAQLGFWDGGNAALHDNGVIDGGAGSWRADGSNWTLADGSVNDAFEPNPTFAVFQGTGGAVTVDDAAGAIGVTGMQFAADGYSIGGDAIALQGTGGNTIIRVGDGSLAGAGMGATISSELTGNTTLVKTDRGTLTLTGTQSYTGGTRVEGGTLIGNAGSIRGDLANAGTVVFDQATDAAFTGAVGGIGGLEGAVVKRGAGELTLSGASTLDWTVETGTLVADASHFGGDVAVNSGASLTFDQSANAVYTGSLSGAGSFNIAGAGRLTLTGNSSAFTGGLTILGGSLVVGTSAGGSLGGTTTIGAGGFLGGVGIMGTPGTTLTIATGGVHAPGNSIGVQTIAGNYVNNGTLRIEAEPKAADKIIVAGSVDISGATLDLVLSPADASNWFVFSGPFTVIEKQSAGAVVGPFGSVTRNLLFLEPILDYAGGDGNDVTLQLKRNGVTFSDFGHTPNQIATAAAIDTLSSSSAVFRAVALSGDAATARLGYDALSGEIHASAKAVLTEDSRFVRNAINDRLYGARADTGAEHAAVWAQGFGSWGHVDGNGNAARIGRSTGGFLLGGDVAVVEDWRFGAVAGYSHTRFDATARGSSGSSDNYHVGLYGGTAWGDLTVRTGAAYSWHDLSTDRHIAFGGFSESVKGSYDAGTAQVFGEVGYGIEMDAARFEPFANLAHVNVDADGFRETGGGAILSSAGGSHDTTFTTLGLRASSVLDLDGATVTARGVIGWRHAFDDGAPTSVNAFQGGSTFVVAGVPIARNTAILEAGLDVALSSEATFGLSYAAQFASGAVDQSLKASLDVKF